MSTYRSFVAEFVRLLLLIVGILAARLIIVSFPMVAELEHIPGLGVSAALLVTAAAYASVLLLLLRFARSIEIVVADESVDGLPWQPIVAQALVLGGILFAYTELYEFAATLLGEHVWTYSLALLLVACVPLFRIGSLIYDDVSRRLQAWED